MIASLPEPTAALLPVPNLSLRRGQVSKHKNVSFSTRMNRFWQMAPATLQARNERHSMSFSPEYKGWILTEQSMLCWVPRGWRRGKPSPLTRMQPHMVPGPLKRVTQRTFDNKMQERWCKRAPSPLNLWSHLSSFSLSGLAFLSGNKIPRKSPDYPNTSFYLCWCRTVIFIIICV